jgi:hypothetical protein
LRSEVAAAAVMYDTVGRLGSSLRSAGEGVEKGWTVLLWCFRSLEAFHQPGLHPALLVGVEKPGEAFEGILTGRRKPAVVCDEPALALARLVVEARLQDAGYPE